MPVTITVDCQTVSKDYTLADKAKRWGRSLFSKAKNFLGSAREKIIELKDAITRFFTKLFKTSKRYSDEVAEIFNEIKEDWDMGGGIIDFLFGPPVAQQHQGDYPTEFSTGNVAGQMMSAVISQRGYVSEEQTSQFQEIAKNAEANAKRVRVALEAIKKVSGAETEVTKEVYKVLSALEKDAFKRSEYQAQRRKESQVMQEKFSNLRRGIE